jgi:sugar lactone lactonase YvrE
MIAKRRLRAAILATCLAVLGTLALAAGPALAFQWTPHTLSSTFNGSDSTGGGFENAVASVAVDQQSGSVYVATSQHGIRIFKFNAEGAASAFTDPALGGSTVLHVEATENCSCAPPTIAVDNSGGPTQGRIYLSNDFIDSRIWAYEPSGEEVGGNFPIQDGPNAVAVEPATGDLWASDIHLIGHLSKFTPEGVETSTDVDLGEYEEGFGPYGLAIDAQGNIYTYPTGIGAAKFSPTGELLHLLPGVGFEFAVDQVSGNLFAPGFNGALEFDSAGDTLPGFPLSGGSPNSIAVNGANGRIYIGSPNSVQIFAPSPAVTLPDVRTDDPSDIQATSVTLNGTVNPAGVTTTSCKFEYGSGTNYGTTVPCSQGQNLSGSSDTPVSVELSGLRQGATYHYRLDAGNANGQLKTADTTFTPSAPPTTGGLFVTDVHSDSALVHGSLNPEGAPTTYHIDYGTGDCLANPGACASTPETGNVGSGLSTAPQTTQLEGLQAGTTYHYDLVATNQSGTTKSAEFTFTTFPFTPVLEDPCPNAHVRQQVGAALLSDCRAYELVSAANAGGYDVESYLVSGQTPFGGYPRAESPSRVLYAVHDGAIPGTNHPTNNGLDPYVATRGADGWNTSYVGIPANLPYSNSFASTLDAADAGLDTFAFGGPNICSPCFADGSTGLPVRLADGSLVQGMTGPKDPGPSANAAILVKKRFSDDGSHLVFGSTSQFVEGAGSPAIYDRDLGTGVTHDVSKLPNGSPIPCLMQCGSDGIAELDISADGSRIVIGQLISVDAAGNHYWHLYIDLGDAPHSIDLMPGASGGALYDGMTADGSKVYMTSADQLTGDDTDSSADIFRADVSGSGAALTRVSGSGGVGNSDSCTPLGNSANIEWNAIAGEEGQCSAVAIGGGGGVAAASGAIYFLSPELLDGPGNGTQNAPNLYKADPGSSPHFVATLESSATGPQPPVEYHRYSHSFGAAQNPQFVAVDASGGPSNGDIYVADNSGKVVRKYDPAGNLITSWGVNGVLNGSTTGSGTFHSISGLAVGPDGSLYVATFVELNGNPDLFKFKQDGTYESSGSLEEAVSPIGISVDSLGRVYYDGFYNETVYRWQEGSGSIPISTWVYESGQKSGLAVDPSSGDLYVNFGGEAVARYSFDGSGNVIEGSGSACSSNCDPTEEFGASEVSGASGFAVDPSNGDLYVDEGNRIIRFDSAGQRMPGPDTGADELSNSSSVAVGGDGAVYATNTTSSGANVAAFSPLVLAPEPSTDNPAVIDGVNDAGGRHTGDFQVSPNGDFAAFTAAIPFTGFDNNGHSEIIRYDALEDELACVSCNPTNARATGNATMAVNGLSLTDGGRVFFNSTDALVPRDLNEREDAYEWADGRVNLISTGISHFDSALLSATADGKDAYFFTRDTLVPQDLNRELVKVYDAREEGGFPSLPPPVPCKASDECHGAGTESPAPANINSVAGTRGNNGAPATNRGSKCRRGYVRHKQRCVRAHHKKGKRSHHRSGGAR